MSDFAVTIRDSPVVESITNDTRSVNVPPTSVATLVIVCPIELFHLIALYGNGIANEGVIRKWYIRRQVRIRRWLTTANRDPRSAKPLCKAGAELIHF